MGWTLSIIHNLTSFDQFESWVSWHLPFFFCLGTSWSWDPLMRWLKRCVGANMHLGICSRLDFNDPFLIHGMQHLISIIQRTITVRQPTDLVSLRIGWSLDSSVAVISASSSFRSPRRTIFKFLRQRIHRSQILRAASSILTAPFGDVWACAHSYRNTEFAVWTKWTADTPHSDVECPAYRGHRCSNLFELFHNFRLSFDQLPGFRLSSHQLLIFDLSVLFVEFNAGF